MYYFIIIIFYRIEYLNDKRDDNNFSQKSRNSFGKLFLIEVNFDINSTINIDNIEFKKNLILNNFFNLENYLCSLEDVYTTENISHKKLNIFLEYSCKINIMDVLEQANNYFYGNEYLMLDYNPWSNVQVKTIKSKRNVLINLSKTDLNLYTNIDVNSLSFSYRANIWAKNTREFSYVDPFVSEHKNCYKFLKEFYDDYWKPKLTNQNLKPMEQCYNNWTLEVAEWWNDMIINPKPRKRQLYIHGRTKMGKSTFIQKIIGENCLPFIFYPEKGQFFMQEFSSYRHKVILFEEFDIRDFPINALKRLLAGETYPYSVKSQKPKIIKFIGPIIFVSNFNEIQDAALKGRLKIVYVNKPYWNDEKILIPKSELELNKNAENFNDKNENENIIYLSD